MIKTTIAILAVTFSAATSHAAMFSNGATLLEAKCAVCHPSSKVKVLKRSPEQWDAIVTSMMKRGAKLNPEEKKVLVDYLAKTYKPYAGK
ncbi:hypothetical protein GMST_09940 [Geomonas silvestris]|uniref:Quinohemoprotein amine dehydrogenase alpha subunit haem binding domain-containing protein n=1 Tax=Geomonas silvestris TaxID=2740184 RepID=A0A6V8MG53_9BACT|nr:hypothetical protein [Geomonas silvestris]GFO58669.1 hypothetical protein GMST_09940 [Geomonas silvestris]